MEKKNLGEVIHVKVGEHIKIISDVPMLQNTFQTFATANSIEHLTLTPGNYQDYVVGHVSYVDITSDHIPSVEVTYPSDSGESNCILNRRTKI
ncbi:hypothetical protein P4308_20065 [Bacillus wiedmannii]|uniref:hypothetical protein n=1 Tax=Bacillus wiedmannii TaxID=1890302 RepID=UPI002E208B03|nr:hypothetical protein [Bacillus wiedmannii]